MAQRKARKGGSKGKAARGRKRPAAPKARRRAPRKAAGVGASAARRIAELEAENRRLRDELAAVRSEGAASPAVDETGEGPPVLGL